MIKRVVAPLSASVDQFRENVTLDSQPQAGVLANSIPECGDSNPAAPASQSSLHRPKCEVRSKPRGLLRDTTINYCGWMVRPFKIVNDKMQRGYHCALSAPMGRNFDPDFCPELTPKVMLALGVFCGKYMSDCRKEFPARWFARAKLSTSGRDCSLNYFGVDASQPLSVWRKKGWIHPDDPRGWFQWYCRYYMGRRMPEEDARQIKRWKAIRRHVAQIKQHCEPGDPMCRPRQRQALQALEISVADSDPDY
jgi:hypothetical protein